MPANHPRRRAGRRSATVGAVLVATLAAALGVAPTVGAGNERSFDVPRLFATQIERIKARSTVAVLLPQTLRFDARRLYPRGGPRRAGWDLGLGAVPGCGGATACFVASFKARRGQRPHFRGKVRLRGGRTGYFKPLTCGASCSPPIIEWRRARVLYSIQARVGNRETERRELVGLANSAIGRGPR